MLFEDIENCDPNNVGAPKLFRSKSPLKQSYVTMNSSMCSDQNVSDHYSKATSSSISSFKSVELAF